MSVTVATKIAKGIVDRDFDAICAKAENGGLTREEVKGILRGMAREIVTEYRSLVKLGEAAKREQP